VIASDQVAVAVKLANGVDVTQGAVADAAVTDPTASGTTIALLKGWLSIFTARAGSSATATGTSSAALAVAANTGRRSLLILASPDNTVRVWVNVHGTATAAAPSIPLDAGGRIVASAPGCPSGAVSIIAPTGSPVVTVVEG
jgi:hypothetical protein